MNLKEEIIAFAIRTLARETNLIAEPHPFETFMSDLFGFETYDRRTAKQIVAETDKAIEAVKRVNTRRKFKKIVEHI